MRRRSVIVLWTLALVVSPLVGNLATNSIKIRDWFVPWLWGGLAVLAVFSALQIYLDLSAMRQQSSGAHGPLVSEAMTTKLRFLGGSLEINDIEVKLVKWGHRQLIVPWSEVRDIRIGVGDTWQGDYAEAVALDSCLLAQPVPGSSLLTVDPSMSAYSPILDRIYILNLEHAGVPRHAVEAALSKHRP